MNVTVAYVCVTHGPKTAELASRFVGSWLAHPPGFEADLLVCCNGGELDPETKLIFAPLDAKFLPRVNDGGWDIAAFQQATLKPDVDLLLCCGETVYWHREGWLRHLIFHWKRSGPGMYGLFSSHSPIAHLNTTAFACVPSQLRTYPMVTTHAERYAFEHGEYAFWRRLNRIGVPCRLVTWDGCWEPGQWRMPPNIMQRGDQSNCLAFCNHTERWHAADAATKAYWSGLSDRAFK